jgi:hypothetical protein
VADADGVVLLADDDLYGALLETGMAMAFNTPVAVISPQRWSIFFMPSRIRTVKVVHSVEDAFDWLESLSEQRRLHGADASINL